MTSDRALISELETWLTEARGHAQRHLVADHATCDLEHHLRHLDGGLDYECGVIDALQLVLRRLGPNEPIPPTSESTAADEAWTTHGGFDAEHHVDVCTLYHDGVEIAVSVHQAPDDARDAAAVLDDIAHKLNCYPALLAACEQLIACWPADGAARDDFHQALEAAEDAARAAVAKARSAQVMRGTAT